MAEQPNGAPMIEAGPKVAVREVVPRGEEELKDVKKLIVAVHGVGDQHSFATLQAVIRQFCRFHKTAAGVPLGAFHDGKTPFIPEQVKDLAFAEVYWATIPRKLVEEQHTVEEAKAWARTIVDRLKGKWEQAGTPAACLESDFSQTTQVLGEMIETIGVADRLCYLADKAGVFTFDLKKVLDDYLGDVQVVTEFKQERDKIMTAFFDALEQAACNCPKSTEIYIVAHSEGTVVTLLGLLDAFRRKEVPAWALKVRGVITIDSPIDKHLHLWPQLFGTAGPTKTPERPIAWRNYYDNGDPIGFELNDLRDWFRDQAGGAWKKVFAFTDDDDYGFTRYALPGKAHVDYWKDDDVFGHFIKTVVDRPGPAAAGGGAASQAASRAVQDADAPRTRKLSATVSLVAPYLGVFALLWVAAYILFKAVVAAIDPNPVNHQSLHIAKDVTWLALLMAGVTIAARVPRLTRHWGWRSLAFGVAALCTLGYVRSFADVESLFDYGTWLPGGNLDVVLGLGVIVGVAIAGAFKPQWGAKPMMALTAIAVAIDVNAAMNMRGAVEGGGQAIARGPGWPVFLAAIAFIYLWWLAALLFDLVVVWHMYIRTSEVNVKLKLMVYPDAQVNAASGASTMRAKTV